MSCLNSRDTITQDAGGPLSNEFLVPSTELDAVVTSSCRTVDGVWVAWFQNYRGDAIDAYLMNARGDSNKLDWPSRVASAVPIGVGFFPDDGSGPIVYQLGLEWPCFTWTGIPAYGDADHCSILFPFPWITNYANSQRSQMTEWFTQVLDVQVRTDGSNVWVIVLARETVDYPFLYDSGTPDVDRCGNGHPSLGTVLASEGGDPFNHDTDLGARWWQHIGGPTPDDPGSGNSFRWEPARVTVWTGDIGGFTRLDTVDAKFLNWDQHGLVSGIECAASPADPGVLHVLWAESGRMDSFLAGYGQRVNYSRWDAGSKIIDTDLLYEQETWGGAYISDAKWVWTAEMIVRNDHGSPIAIVWPWLTDNGPIGASPAAEFWDLSAGTHDVIQTADPGLALTAGEAGTIATPVVAGGLLGEPFVPRRSQFASSLYTDPLLGDTDVYLLCVAYGDNTEISGGGSPARQALAFYRIACDGSTGFSFLDGKRAAGYSILKGATMGCDFVSDPDNVWVPQDGSFNQLDRQCLKGWLLDLASPYESSGYLTADWTSGATNTVSPPTIVTRADGDWLVGGGVGSPHPSLSPDPVPVASLKAKICRCCLPCVGKEVHLWQRI